MQLVLSVLEHDLDELVRLSLKTGVPAPGGDPSAGRGPRREAVPQDDTGDVVVVRELERRVRTTKETPFTAHRLRPPRAGDELVSTTHQCPRRGA